MADDEQETWTVIGRVLEGEWAIWSARREIRRRDANGSKRPAATRINIRDQADGRAVSLPVLTGSGVSDNETE